MLTQVLVVQDATFKGSILANFFGVKLTSVKGSAASLGTKVMQGGVIGNSNLNQVTILQWVKQIGNGKASSWHNSILETQVVSLRLI